jgi:hypothetical protein
LRWVAGQLGKLIENFETRNPLPGDNVRSSGWDHTNPCVSGQRFFRLS